MAALRSEAMSFRIQLNPQREGRFLGGQESIVASSAEGAIKQLGAQPGDALWVEPVDCDVRFVYLVARGPRGLCAIPA